MGKQKNNKKFFTLIRNDDGEVVEIHYFLNKIKLRKKNTFTFDQILNIMNKERLQKLEYIGPEKKQKIPSF